MQQQQHHHQQQQQLQLQLQFSHQNLKEEVDGVEEKEGVEEEDGQLGNISQKYQAEHHHPQSQLYEGEEKTQSFTSLNQSKLSEYLNYRSPSQPSLEITANSSTSSTSSSSSSSSQQHFNKNTDEKEEKISSREPETGSEANCKSTNQLGPQGAFSGSSQLEDDLLEGSASAGDDNCRSSNSTTNAAEGDSQAVSTAAPTSTPNSNKTTSFSQQGAGDTLSSELQNQQLLFPSSLPPYHPYLQPHQQQGLSPRDQLDSKNSTSTSGFPGFTVRYLGGAMNPFDEAFGGHLEATSHFKLPGESENGTVFDSTFGSKSDEKSNISNEKKKTNRKRSQQNRVDDDEDVEVDNEDNSEKSKSTNSKKKRSKKISNLKKGDESGGEEGNKSNSPSKAKSRQTKGKGKKVAPKDSQNEDNKNGEMNIKVEQFEPTRTREVPELPLLPFSFPPLPPSLQPSYHGSSTLSSFFTNTSSALAPSSLSSSSSSPPPVSSHFYW